MIMWIAVGAGLSAAGSGIGWLVARRIAQHRGPGAAPGWPVMLCAGMMLALLRPIMAGIEAPDADSVLADMERTQPVIARLRAHAPKVHDELRQIVAAALRHHRDLEDTRRQMRQVIGRSLRDRMRTASDAHLAALATLIGDQAVALGQSNPYVCVAMLRGGGVDTSPYLPEDLLEREAMLLADVVAAPPMRNAPAATDREIQDAVTALLPDIATASGASVQEAAGVFQGKGSDALQCRVGAEFHRRLATAPGEGGVRLRRALMTGK